MSTVLSHTWYMAGRHVRSFLRQPIYVAFGVVQPVIWLFLFGQLFKRVVDIPGFGAGSYISYLTPAVVIMTVLFGAGWSGMGIIDDLNRGVIDRFLITPASRISVIAGRIIVTMCTVLIQSMIILGLGAIGGARYANTFGGILIMLLTSTLLGAAIGALSNGLALAVRREESVIAAANFILLPLQFLSTGFMALVLMPKWMQHVAAFNPVNWALSASRSALSSSPDWGYVFAHVGYLFALTIFCGWVATRAFRGYQRSV